MTANELLATLRNDGRQVTFDRNRLLCNPVPEGELLELVKQNKPALIRLLEIELVQDTALKIIEICPSEAEKIDTLLGEAIAGEWSDYLELQIRVVEAFARFIDPEYRAAIWGNKTWSEANGTG